MKKLFPLLTFLGWCAWHPVSGQTNGQATVDNATTPYTFTNNNQLNNSLGGNGSNAYNVDLYTGAANVNIPIYNYSVDGINAGISLSYNTLGIKVDQLASSVGLGWNLNAAPSITRQVNGIEDEVTLPAFGWVNFNFVLPQMSGAWGRYAPETDNDKFTINFGDRSVDFIIKFPNTTSSSMLTGVSNNTNINVTAYVDGVAVSSNFDSTMDTHQNSQVLTFKVIDEFGNQYFFDRGDYEYKAYVDTTASGTHNTFMYYPADKWNLTELVTWKGNVINYKYAHYDNIVYPLYQNRQIKEVKQYRNVGNTDIVIKPSIQLLVDSVVNWRGTMSQISEIDYPNGVVAHFNVHSNDRLDLAGVPYISNITMEGSDNAYVDNKLEYNLKYSYFNTDPNNPDISNEFLPVDEYNYRLKLNGIDRYGTDNATFEPYYSFTYNTSSLLPQRLSPYQDLYGYYSGVVPALNLPSSAQASGVADGFAASLPDITLCPMHTFNYSYTDGLFNNNIINSSVTYGIDKTDNIYNSQSCILTSMTNALGGTTSFFYKAHQLHNPPQDTYNATNKVTDGPHYYDQHGYSEELPPDDNPTLNMEYTNVNDGVCLDSILNTDGYNPDNNTVTKYAFQNGMRFFTGGYYWYPTVTENGPYTVALGCYLPDNPTINVDSLENTWDERVYTNTVLSSQDQINGANHGYGDVTVTTYGYNDEFISAEHTRFTNVISQAGEFDSIIRNKPISQFPTGYLSKAYPVNSSRILASCGLFMHMLPRYSMDKHLMGLPVEIDDYDKFGDTTHKTINQYRESINDYNTPVEPIKDYQPMRVVSTRFGINMNTTFVGTGASTLYWPYIPFSAATAILVSSSSSDYANGRIMTTWKICNYDSMDNLTRTYYLDSKGIANSIGNGVTYFNANKYKMFLGWDHQINGFYTGSVGYNSGYTGSVYRVTSVNTLRFATPAANGLLDFQYFTVFDAKSNVCEVWHQSANTYNSALWDTRTGQKVASVMNSRYTEMAYTSFEGGFLTGVDSNKGHWNFNTGQVIYDTAAKPMTGKYYYYFVNNDRIFSEYPLVNGKNYYISFWAQGNILNAYLNNNGLAIPLTAQTVVNGWTLYTGYATGNGNPLFLAFGSNGGQNYSGSCKVDELRLYPADATMETFTYEPLLGPSSHCDDRNNITYMQYDVLGRPTVTRDINGNIIAVTSHITQGNDN